MPKMEKVIPLPLVDAIFEQFMQRLAFSWNLFPSRCKFLRKVQFNAKFQTIIWDPIPVNR